MKCSNCGAELNGNSLICPRCGARNRESFGNVPKARDTKGWNGKIIGILISLFLVVGLSVVIVGHLNSTKANNKFTHETTFDSNKLTVVDNDTLRHIQVSPQKTFSIGGDKGYVDVRIIDELGNKANYTINKTDKENRFVIKPQGAWESIHTYHITLGENTYFTDEDMFKFKKLIFTIKRKKESNYKMKDNIKNLINNPTEVVEVGDIVTMQDENGEYVCRKVLSTNGSTFEYGQVALTEVFDDLVLIDEFKPDFAQLLENGELQNNILMNIIKSDYFDAFLMTTYGAELTSETTIKKFEWDIDKGEKVSIADQLLNNTKLVMKPEQFGDLTIELNIDAETIKKRDGIKYTVTVTKNLTPSEKDKLTYAGIKDLKVGDNTVGFAITVKINPTIISNIDLKNLVFEIDNYSEASIDLSIFGSFKYEKKFEDNLVNNKLKKLNREKINFSDDEEAKLLLNLPITTPIPFVNFFFRISFIPEFTGEINVKAGAHIIMKESKGVYWTIDSGFGMSKLIEKKSDEDNKFYVNIDGKVEMDFPFKITTGFEVFLGIEAPLIGKVGAKLGNANIFIKIVPFANFTGKGEAELNLSNPDESGITKLEISLGVGVKFEAGLEGEIRILKDKPGLSGKISAIKGTFYIYQWKYAEKASKSEIKNIINVGEEGSIMLLDNKTPFLVVRKVESEGKALLIADEGVFVAPYDDATRKNKDGGLVTWANSSLDEYLNDTYYNSFSDLIKTSIVPTDVKAAGSEGFNVTGDAKDRKIFILSKEELLNGYAIFQKNKGYMELRPAKDMGVTGYVAQETDPNRHSKKGNTVYWVRNLVNSFTAMVVNSDGTVNEQGAPIAVTNYAVRPAMWIRFRNDDGINAKFESIQDGIIGAGEYDSAEMKQTLDDIEAYIGERDAIGDYNTTFDQMQ